MKPKLLIIGLAIMAVTLYLVVVADLAVTVMVMNVADYPVRRSFSADFDHWSVIPPLVLAALFVVACICLVLHERLKPHA